MSKDMKEIETKTVKTLGYKLGQALAAVSAICLMALIVGVTAAILLKLF
jgi:hypothetical protein